MNEQLEVLRAETDVIETTYDELIEPDPLVADYEELEAYQHAKKNLELQRAQVTCKIPDSTQEALGELDREHNQELVEAEAELEKVRAEVRQHLEHAGLGVASELKGNKSLTQQAAEIRVNHKVEAAESVQGTRARIQDIKSAKLGLVARGKAAQAEAEESRRFLRDYHNATRCVGS